ncbi:MAG: hypothetical protein MI863_16300 [Desulfobacterales bacterium]|nr:hypothetical protein [Desulfobacterales bacterium]
MEINQDINYRKNNLDLPQMNQPKDPQEKQAGTSTEKSPADAPGASTVSLSEEGRAASFTFDFNAEAENLAKLEILGKSNSFAKAHASISYDKVKHLL